MDINSAGWIDNDCLVPNNSCTEGGHLKSVYYQPGRSKHGQVYTCGIRDNPRHTQRGIARNQQIRGGSKQDIAELTGVNLRFVISGARQHKNRGLPLTDLIREGNIGLIKTP